MSNEKNIYGNENYHALVSYHIWAFFSQLKTRSHCDGNGKFFQTFFYAVTITMWTLQLVTMIPIFAIAVAVMNEYWTHSWWQSERHQNNENYHVAIAVWTSMHSNRTGCSGNLSSHISPCHALPLPPPRMPTCHICPHEQNHRQV